MWAEMLDTLSSCSVFSLISNDYMLHMTGFLSKHLGIELNTLALKWACPWIPAYPHGHCRVWTASKPRVDHRVVPRLTSTTRPPSANLRRITFTP